MIGCGRNGTRPTAPRSQLALRERRTDITSWISLDVGWGQRYLVTTVCRMLYSLATGEVTSKKGALRWASAELDPTWRPLLAQVEADRPSGFDLAERSSPERVAQALALAEEAAARLT